MDIEQLEREFDKGLKELTQKYMPYHLRHPKIEDLPDLIVLEALCWSENLRVDNEEIERRILQFPQGQFILELENKIVGAIYSQRIDNPQLLENKTYTQIPLLHTELGVVVQLLAVNILPDLQNLGLGDRLLEFMLQYCAHISGVERVVAVTLCRNYLDYSPMPMAEYIHKKNDSGLLVDQLLRFHQIHGAKIKKVLPGYRPKDLENQGCGVLIEYDIHNRQSFDGVGVEKNRQEKVEIEEDVDEFVAGCVRVVMNQKYSFDSERPLMEMGIESLELLELKYLLEKKLGVKIEPNFFFKYGTAKAIASYFKGETPGKHKNISEFLPKIAQPEPKAQKNNSGFSAAQLENGIAIIGMACRFPGGSDSPQKYWSLLRDGIDAITEVPPTRWDIEKYYNPNKNQPGKISSFYGGFISEVDKFDAEFFQISPREAKYIDPQQRILLEENWKALENAGINPESLSGTETGVFVGIAFHDYEQLQYKHYQKQDLNLYFATGSSSAIGAGRLSYFLKLNGPAITVDTACSSSLTAVHVACQSIRNGECELALASGVNLLLSPELSISFSQAGMLSPDGRCKTFDASANGYVRSEGCGVVVLKSLKQAIADKDKILAVVRGTAINQDGASNGMTAPNQSAQEAVIRKALSVAGMSANHVSYVEAHGTGTSLGDPVEIEALEAVYGNNRGSERPLMIGSVKTNIGHTEAAAGIAGLIKVVLSLQNKYIPPHLHLKELNPYMSLAGIPGIIPMEGKPWELYDGDRSRLAAVSSFGFSGTNAHVILEEVPQTQDLKVKSEDRPYLLTLSAKTEKALDELVSHYQNYLETNLELDLADVCYTANTGRAQFNHRLAVIATNPQELTKRLLQHKAGQEIVGVFLGKLPSNSSYPKLAFLFTGQGSQYVNMGRQLYETQPTFRQALEQCNQILRSYLEHPLLEILYHQDAQKLSASLIDQTAYTQPALFAIEYALAKLWQSWGIKPDVVMGHSVGEYVAACVAGIFSLEDGLKLIAMRGKLMQKLPFSGEMVSVMASESQVKEAIGEYSSQVTIAAINGPESIVISGKSEAIASICSKVESKGVKTKQLQVSHAFHSPLMAPMLTEFEAVAKQVSYNQPQIPLISNVTGEKVGGEIRTAEYWTRHVREPVRFAQSMKTLDKEGYEVFLEIGAKPILLGMGRQCLPESEGEWLPSLRPGVDEWQQMLSSLGKLYVRGAKIDWLGLEKNSEHQKVVLPTYPFQRERYWIETNDNFWSKQQLSTGQNLHPLLGQKLNCAGSQKIFASQIGENFPGYLSQYRVFNQALFHTTGYLEIAIAAGNEQYQTSQMVIEDLIISRGWLLAVGELTSVQTILTPIDSQSHKFQIFFQPEEKQEWILHSTGKIRKEQIIQTPKKIDLEKYQRECNQAIEVKEHYQKVGIDYGKSFQGIQKLWSGSNQALAYIKLPEDLRTETNEYNFHPALLDAALQVTFQALPATDSDKTYLPIGIEEFKVYKNPGLSLWAYASVTSSEEESPESLTTTLTIISPEGEMIATAKGYQVKQATKETLLGTEPESIKNWLYEVEWRRQGILGRLGVPDFLLPPVEITQKLSPSLRELVSQVYSERTEYIDKKLEELSVDYIVQTLQEMGWSYKPKERWEFDAVAQKLGIVPSHRKLLKRLLEILTEEGILKYNQQQWQVEESLEKEVKPSEKSQSLQEQYPEAGATLTLLERCATQLRGVLRGAIDPVQLVFPQGDLTTATQLYEKSTVAKVMNTIVEKAITLAIKKLPKSRGIRLLEIGGGTGGTTSYILPHLNPQQTEYTFTDIGALFTTKAQEKFRDYKFIIYQTLDIEADLKSQGLEGKKYDVIIAANVLHATTSMKETLSHVRELLADGGMLVLLEATAKTRWVDLVFGLLEGWWKFSDYELRPDYPLMSRSQWKKVLRETGFTEVVTMPEVEGMAETFSRQTVIIAQSSQTKLYQTNESSTSWLILADSQGIGKQLGKKLSSVGEVCTFVFAGEKYQQIAPEEFIINPNNLSEFEELIETVARTPSLYGVVNCWGTEGGNGEGINYLELENLSKLGCGTSLYLVQALVKAGLSIVPRLWLVTSGAQAVPSNHPVIPGVVQSGVWGMGKVIRLEHPELNCTCIDLDPEETLEGQGDALFKEIWSEDKEDQVAWRGDGRYVARLVASRHRQPVAHTTKSPLTFHSDATYLITGGLGGLGLLIARWMVDKGAKHLVLLGRRSPDDIIREKLTELEMVGAKVVVEKADVSQFEAVEGVLNRIEQSNRPLAGVIHSAGTLSDGVLQNQSWSGFEKVLAPKVQGAWHLHKLTQKHQLDFFLLFSSVASLLGSPGQGNHSTASGFLDGLAHYRRTMGLPGLSIQWGRVAQVGKAAERGADVTAHQEGMGTISPAQVLESLELLMSGQPTTEDYYGIEVGVVPIQWSQWQERAAKWKFLADWQENILEVAEPSKSDFLFKLEATPPSERRSLLVAHVRRQVAQVLGINHPESISLERGFFELGMDSLTSVELRNKLQTSLKCSISSTLAFDYPKVNKLVDHLAQQLNLIDVQENTELRSLNLSKEKSSGLSDPSPLTEVELEASVIQAIERLEKLI